MPDKINGRTPEEIKRGLKCYNCKTCPYKKENCGDVDRDALALIQQLETERDQYKRERDAAVEQLKEVDKEDLFGCTHCKHNVKCSETLLWCNGCDNSECPCNTCVDLSNWQWRGVQEVE